MCCTGMSASMYAILESGGFRQWSSILRSSHVKRSVICWNWFRWKDWNLAKKISLYVTIEISVKRMFKLSIHHRQLHWCHISVDLMYTIRSFNFLFVAKYGNSNIVCTVAHLSNQSSSSYLFITLDMEIFDICYLRQSKVGNKVTNWLCR